VRASRKFLTATTCLLLLGTPLLACLVPGTKLTFAEQQCCRQMSGDCGQGKMQASHACCKTVVRPAQHPLAKTASGGAQAPVTTAAFVTSQPISCEPMDAELACSSPAIHSPPEFAPGSATILRI